MSVPEGFEDLSEKWTNGWAVLAHLSQVSRTGESRFVRVIGPFETLKEAERASARIRRKLKRAVDQGVLHRVDRVEVETLWKEEGFVSLQ